MLKKKKDLVAAFLYRKTKDFRVKRKKKKLFMVPTPGIRSRVMQIHCQAVEDGLSLGNRGNGPVSSVFSYPRRERMMWIFFEGRKVVDCVGSMGGGKRGISFPLRLAE